MSIADQLVKHSPLLSTEGVSVRNLTARWRKGAPALNGLLGLVVTDLESFTSWVEKLGDKRALTWIREHNRIVREALAEADGCEVAHTGDGLIAAFRSLDAALRCTQDIQTQLAEYSETHTHAPLCARIGVHAGEPLPEDGRLFGSCINATVRVCAHAKPGQTLVSEVVTQLAQGRGYEFEPSAEISLKGLPNQFKLYELLRAQDHGRQSRSA